MSRYVMKLCFEVMLCFVSDSQLFLSKVPPTPLLVPFLCSSEKDESYTSAVVQSSNMANPCVMGEDLQLHNKSSNHVWHHHRGLLAKWLFFKNNYKQYNTITRKVSNFWRLQITLSARKSCTVMIEICYHYADDTQIYVHIDPNGWTWIIE